MTASYVHRTRPGREGWVGSIRSPAQAEREAAAWRQAGWEATVHPTSPQVRARVRAWEKRAKGSLVDEPAGEGAGDA